ncbi:MAG: trypsin-like peptidase domain-containing protein, partial [Gammaproteobacteria bacterium]|nr:trypsin-like peptidase domain-containing protein [Gammaproteobacteria bacterium]
MGAQVASAATAASSAAECTPGGTASLPDFTPLVARYGPAVVNIEVIEKAEAGAGGDDPLNDFFRRFGIPAPGNGQQRHEQPVRGAGSGFIVSPDGYILTNGHVVQGASQVTVRLVDQREFKARVVGTDERTDIAVLKIAAAGLPVVRFGDPARLRPGQWVLAIGSPFGFENSATAGIVSAIGRSLPTENYVPFIQTDVAVNPGNSGGP